MTASVEHLTVEANGLRFYAAATGPTDGPLVLLLHGFPEFSYGWRHQLHELGAAGLRAVAPDQRGYGYSAKPRGVRAYRLDRLAEDVVAIAAALGHEQFMLVGHDWGGIVAWHLASTQGDRIRRLAILNAPNLGVATQFAARHPLQLIKSSYVAFFQLPLLPELSLTSWKCALLASALQRSSRLGTFSPEELETYREAWTQEGAMTAMLNWYRAMPLDAPHVAQRIRLPVRVIWGDQDSALEPLLAEESSKMCDDVEIFHLSGATHWLHHEEPIEINRLLLNFLRGSPTKPG